jgi:hypothetical protein
MVMMTNSAAELATGIRRIIRSSQIIGTYSAMKHVAVQHNNGYAAFRR